MRDIVLISITLFSIDKKLHVPNLIIPVSGLLSSLSFIWIFVKNVKYIRSYFGFVFDFNFYFYHSKIIFYLLDIIILKDGRGPNIELETLDRLLIY